jgi:putative transposase
MRLIKESFTRAYLKTHVPFERSVSRRMKGEQGIWQRRFWEHVIRDDADYEAHLNYIHLNPVHHGLATAPCEWPHSSFRQWVDRGAYDITWGSDTAPEVPDWAKQHE